LRISVGAQIVSHCPFLCSCDHFSIGEHVAPSWYHNKSLYAVPRSSRHQSSAILRQSVFPARLHKPAGVLQHSLYSSAEFPQCQYTTDIPVSVSACPEMLPIRALSAQCSRTNYICNLPSMPRVTPVPLIDHWRSAL
jgi:hypothetical protein